MKDVSYCFESGASVGVGQTCQDRFEQFLAWEYENIPHLGSVHHLMVLCFHLQHPSRYSPEGLMYAIQLLRDFTERGKTPTEIRHQNREQLSSNQRHWKITRTKAAHGRYSHPVSWKMTTADIVAGGKDQYCETVRQWSKSVLQDLITSANISVPERE